MNPGFFLDREASCPLDHDATGRPSRIRTDAKWFGVTCATVTPSAYDVSDIPDSEFPDRLLEHATGLHLALAEVSCYPTQFSPQDSDLEFRGSEPRVLPVTLGLSVCYLCFNC